MPVFKHLQKEVEHVRMRLLDFVQQDDRVRCALHALGELFALLVAHISRRQTDHLRDRVLHELGHVEAHQRLLTAEHTGADGNFNLYEDEGDGYRYEQGAHTILPIQWDDANRTLTIGDREGSYPGMATEHTFNVVLVAAGRGAGGEAVGRPDNVIQYTGARTVAKF